MPRNLDSTPLPRIDISHKLHLMERRLVDGGVVVLEWMPFCSCGWSMKFTTRYRDRALRIYNKHIECSQCTTSCNCD